MHIAICDDNAADRKQAERLLSRESDKRIHTTGNLYVDSFGNADALLAASLTYDAYYIDMCKTEGISGSDLVNALVKKGIHSTFILCCSDIDYRKQSFPGNVLFLDKPLKVAELSESIDLALEHKDNTPSLIELRADEKTYYVTESEIMYGIEEGRYVEFTLTEGRKVKAGTSASNFFFQEKNHSAFMVPSAKVVINCRYISKFGFHKVIMTDGTKFQIHKDCVAYAKSMYTQLHSNF